MSQNGFQIAWRAGSSTGSRRVISTLDRLARGGAGSFFLAKTRSAPPSKRVFGAPPYSIHDLVEGADDQGYV
jgi:hypothetical protein